jgi:hypothetical protein
MQKIGTAAPKSTAAANPSAVPLPSIRLGIARILLSKLSLGHTTPNLRVRMTGFLHGVASAIDVAGVYGPSPRDLKVRSDWLALSADWARIGADLDRTYADAVAGLGDDTTGIHLTATLQGKPSGT